MNPPTTLTNHNPPATTRCGLNPNPIRREKSETPQQAAPAPTTAVANLALAEGDNGSVTVTWDPVPDASSYNVDYTAQAQDGATHTAGFFDDVTATSLTFDHGITSAATVTVTVTPGHKQPDDTTQYHNDLAATATINTGSTTRSVEPEITITASNDVTEGSDATFTITASPAPAAGLDVSVEITQSGDFASTGTQTVTIPTSGTYTLTVATTNDNTDEPDGSVTATVNDGTGYSVSATAATASVAVSDNDPPPDCVSDKTLKLARDYYDLNRHRAPGYGKNWRRVLIAFGDITDTQLEAFTAAEARQSETRWSGWRPFREALECIEQAQQDQDPAPPPEPEITITAGNDVTEGTDATFTITAAPTPAADLTVTVEITQTGDYATTGTQTVTIPTSGTYTLVVATTDDSTDEPDGSITATIDNGTGYSVSSTDSDATVNVADDDDPPPVTPQISIVAGSAVTEGSDATFTITAAPAPPADLTVNITVTQSGDPGTATGTRTITIPTSGTYTLTVTTTNDTTDEPDGSITVTIDAGTGYSVSSTDSAATVNVADDDIPEITITAGADVTEGGDATFTITAAPTPHAALDVTVTVTQTGDHGATTGSRTVTVPTSGTYTLVVATSDDNTDEPDGTITATATVDDGAGYSVSSSDSAATVAVADDDPPEDDDPPDPVPSGPPTLSIADASVSEGDTQGLRFVVEVTPASDQTITLGYGVFDGSASSGRDFNAPYQVFTLNPGDTRLEIIVPVIDDNDTEDDETLTLYLYATSGITIPNYFLYATGTITDND